MAPIYTAPDTLGVLRDGIDAGPAQDVVIVGAGVAGLVAANLLQDAGWNVKVLEAQQRPGGRIYTHTYPDGRYAEIGGMRYAPGHVLAQHLFDKYGMTTEHFPLSYKEGYINGRRGMLADTSLADFGFRIDKSVPELMEKTMGDALSVFDQVSDQDEAFAQFIAEHDSYSIRDWLAKQELTQDEIAAVALLNNIEGRMPFSFAEWANYVREDAFGDKLIYVTEGAQELLQRMTKGVDIHYGAVVTHINQSLSKTRITAVIGGKERVFTSDYAIVTPPPIVLRRIRIEGLDAAKRGAIRAAYSGRAAKVFLQFSRRWWEDFTTEGGMVVTDLPSRNIVFTIAGQGDGERGQIIGSYTWESDSMVLAAMSEEDRCTAVLDDVCEIFPQARELYEGGIAYDWGQAPFSGGVGGLFTPHEMTSPHYQKLLQPVGRVWFAGETYDRKSRRWIESAARSSIKNVVALTQGKEEMSWLD